ncbi:MAG: hypothetical protein KA314_19000 [Chloroflexi bacterium]|nr:hypothetical protein [Chloroflexota bacterium]MBP8057922.1 hypothetical protein [Chloroflexota bacterium]
MSHKNEIQVQVHRTNGKKPIARIALNGYNIESGGPLGLSGAMRSFRIIKGDLWDQWNNQELLLVRGEEHPDAQIKIAALPAEDDSFGFVEFI